jgi:hypothetical protein
MIKDPYWYNLEMPEKVVVLYCLIEKINPNQLKKELIEKLIGPKFDPVVIIDSIMFKVPEFNEMPTINDISEYIRNKYFYTKDWCDSEAKKIYDYYEATGWRIGKHKKQMVSWRNVVNNWIRNAKNKPDTSKVSEAVKAYKMLLGQPIN